MALICSETLLFILQFGTRADAKVSEKNVPSTRKLHERPREGTERPRRVLMDSFPSGPAGPLIAALWGSRNETAYFCLCNWARVGLCGPAQTPVGCLQYLFARQLLQRPDRPPGYAARTVLARPRHFTQYPTCAAFPCCGNRLS